MKKKIVLILVVIIGVLSLWACSNREEEEPPKAEGIVISFVTGFDNIVIDPLYLDGVSTVYMPEDPFEAGYTFLGWYYDKDGKNAYQFSDPLTKDTILYAKWEKKVSGGEKQSGGEEELVTESGLHFSPCTTGYAVTKYDGTDKTVTVPIFYADKTVTEIRDNAFAGSVAESIHLPACIRTVADGAFIQARYLKVITVAGDNSTFCDQNGILYNKEKTEIIFLPQAKLTATDTFFVGKAVEKIHANAFYNGCYSVSFEKDSVCQVVGSKAFASFMGVVQLNGVKELQQECFYEATCLIDFTDCLVTSFTMRTFSGYKGRSSGQLTLPSTITSLSGAPFSGCTASIDLSALTITSLGEHAFAEYVGTALVIPKTIKTLGKYCFKDCSATVTFEEGSSYATIQEETFADLSGTVYLPDSVKKVEKNAFWNASSTSHIVFATLQKDIEIAENAFKLCKGFVEYTK